MRSFKTFQPNTFRWINRTFPSRFGLRYKPCHDKLVPVLDGGNSYIEGIDLYVVIEIAIWFRSPLKFTPVLTWLEDFLRKRSEVMNSGCPSMNPLWGRLWEGIPSSHSPGPRTYIIVQQSHHRLSSAQFLPFIPFTQCRISSTTKPSGYYDCVFFNFDVKEHITKIWTIRHFYRQVY